MSAVVLITGAAARVGRYLAFGLAQDGWTVLIHYNRSEKPAQELVQEIKSNGGKAYAIGANLAVPSERDSLINKAGETANTPLTALINNASTFDDDRARDFTRASYDHHMDINLFAPIKLAQNFAAQLPKDQKGCVINMVDQRVLNPDPSYFTYAISKSALAAATKTLAQSLAPNIRVNTVGPGPTLQNTAQSAETFAAEQKATLLGTGSPPSTLLHGVRYLLSADAVTGQFIAIDGGQHLSRTRT